MRHILPIHSAKPGDWCHAPKSALGNSHGPIKPMHEKRGLIAWILRKL